MPPMRRDLSVDDYVGGVESGDRALLARAITLIESQARRHEPLAREVIDRVMPKTGGAIRVGITGVPGVGKSTFIEAVGQLLVEQGHRVAVLAIDPSSSRSGGSILGDKTRMEKLGADARAFIRPSPAGATLGGVARKTRETMLLCEAAGYDVILVETVGVGQSETVVHDMVDYFLVLMLAGAGDELQGIKRGVLEMADGIVVNKADGDNIKPAKKARRTYANALHVMHGPNEPWQPDARTCSALTGEGLQEVWDNILEHRTTLTDCGVFAERRRDQQVRWMWAMIEERLIDDFRRACGDDLARVEEQVRSARQGATKAAADLLQRYQDGPATS